MLLLPVLCWLIQVSPEIDAAVTKYREASLGLPKGTGESTDTVGRLSIDLGDEHTLGDRRLVVVRLFLGSIRQTDLRTLDPLVRDQRQ